MTMPTTARRALLGAGAALPFAAPGLVHAQAGPPIRYPDPAIKVLDPRFEPLVVAIAAIERIAGGCRFTEGPVWLGDLRQLVFSDIPNDRLMRWDEETGAVSLFRRPAGYPDGITRDRQGRLIVCELGTRRLTRTEHDGTGIAGRLAKEGDGAGLFVPAH